MRLFSTEQVSKYHPDKYADQISDAIVTACLKEDPNSRVACEVMVKDTTIILGGEIRTNAKVNYNQIARKVAQKLHYKANKVINLIGEQSNEIYEGTTKDNSTIGAGDQGIMFGYACNETESYLPYAFDLANRIIHIIEQDVERNRYSILKGDAKTQITTDLDKQQNIGAIHTILVSVCHKRGKKLELVKEYVKTLIEPLLKGFNGRLIINPAGTWTIGGPIADCGITGRKIVCDQYGGFCPVGGGAFSGKDPSKVDRSAAYMARTMATDIIKNFKTIRTCQIQLAYAIGVAEPINMHILTDGVNAPDNVYRFLKAKYNLTPNAIIDTLELSSWDYESVAEGCHFRFNTNRQSLAGLPANGGVREIEI